MIAGGDTSSRANYEDGEMSRVSLKDFAQEHGQSKAARLLGMTQGSLNKALKVGRDVYVTKKKDGSFSAEELRPFPSPAGKRTTGAEVEIMGKLSA